MVFKHGFQAGRLTIRANGTEIYSQHFSGGTAKSGFKGMLSKASKMVKRSVFKDFGIQVPVGRYPLEIKVTVPGKDIDPVHVNARFKVDQERCISIETKRINRDEIQVRWDCEDDEDDEDEDEDDDKEKDEDD